MQTLVVISYLQYMHDGIAELVYAYNKASYEKE